jgi:hypothetical protein
MGRGCRIEIWMVGVGGREVIGVLEVGGVRRGVIIVPGVIGVEGVERGFLS